MLLLAFIPAALGRHYIAMFESTQNVTLKPPESWREALLDTRVMDLFLTVSPPPYNPALTHHLALILLLPFLPCQYSCLPFYWGTIML